MLSNTSLILLALAALSAGLIADTVPAMLSALVVASVAGIVLMFELIKRV